MKWKLGVIFAFSTIYAILRYHVFGPVLDKDLFLYTLNKIFIFSAVLIMLYRVISRYSKEKELLRKWILVLISLHIILSLLLVRPYYFPDFFLNEKGFSFKGNLVLIGGAITAILFLFKENNFFPKIYFKYLVLIFITIHLVSMGIDGWLKPWNWHGFMPPITLLSYLIFIIWFLIKRK